MKKYLLETIEVMRYILLTYRVFIVGSFLALICIGLGARLTVIHPGGVLRGIVATFLLVTGIQVGMWCLGIRTELFGNMPDPVDANELDYEVNMHRQRLGQALIDSQREIEELRIKLAQATRRADAPR